jgi:CHAT domain-containing protein
VKAIIAIDRHRLPIASRSKPVRWSPGCCILAGWLVLSLGAACSGDRHEVFGHVPETGGAAEPSAVARAVFGDAPLSDPAPVAHAREHPDSVRDEIARSLRLAASAPAPPAAAAHLARARALADAYTEAWSDSFFIRQVSWFEDAGPGRRRDAATADSLRREGRISVGRDGVPAAALLWRESLRLAAAAEDSAGLAATLANLGAGFYMAGELDSAAVYLERAERLARTIGDHRTAGNALGNLASVSKDRGDLARAAELYREASAVRQRSGDDRGHAADHNNLGLIARYLGDLAGARQAFEEALALNRSGGRDRAAALNLANLGDLASIESDYATAQAHYERALDLNRSAGDLAETGFVLHDLGLLAARRGDYANAIELFAEALAVHERSGADSEALAVRGDLAAVQAAAGDMAGALASLERAARDEAGAALPAVQARLVVAHAELLLQLGSYGQAEVEYARAERLYREARDAAGRAGAQAGHATLRLLREDHDGALRLIRLAARTHAAERDQRAVALTRLLEGDVLRQQGDTAAAREALTAAHVTLAHLGDAPAAAAALSALAELALQRGAVLEAESLYAQALDELGEALAADVRWRLHAGLGRALRRRGALEPAAEQLRASIAVIENVAAGLHVAERRSGFLSDKWQPYADLAMVERERGRAAEAFAVSERMRARQMLALLERGRVTTRRDPSQREQDLRRRIGELMRAMEAATGASDGLREPALETRSADVLREALAAAQKEYADLLLELRSADPAYALLVAPESVDWRDAASRLEPDMALLQYLVADSGSTVFVVTRDTVAAIDLDITRRELANLVDFTRGVIDGHGERTTGLLWRAPLRRLHRHLIEPVDRAGHLQGKRRLVIVPHAELHFLPFGALLEPDPVDRFLVERFQLAYAPSASVWTRLAARSPRPARRVLALAPRTDRLPASRDEAAGIRDVFGRRATVLVGTAATKRALLAAAPRYDILHLASYGVLNKHNPLFSYIELAASLGDAGRLEVHELFDLELDGQLVVLSACQTGLGAGALADVPAGDDWVGLTQGFLQAGAGSVLASLWRVEDRATARLMQQFYRYLRAGENDAAALARAQGDLLRDPHTAHPFYWAGFVLNRAGRN